MERIVADFTPRNRALVAHRSKLQHEIDAWHRAHPGPIRDPEAYVDWLREIGYLVDEPGDFTIETENIDADVLPDDRGRQRGPSYNPREVNEGWIEKALNLMWTILTQPSKRG